jgi:hypothetical protein
MILNYEIGSIWNEVVVAYYITPMWMETDESHARNGVNIASVLG